MTNGPEREIIWEEFSPNKSKGPSPKEEFAILNQEVYSILKISQEALSLQWCNLREMLIQFQHLKKKLNSTKNKLRSFKKKNRIFKIRKSRRESKNSECLCKSRDNKKSRKNKSLAGKEWWMNKGTSQEIYRCKTIITAIKNINTQWWETSLQFTNPKLWKEGNQKQSPLNTFKSEKELENKYSLFQRETTTRASLHSIRKYEMIVR